ncbi:hypothetical protein LB504_001868 [Fusarium proliferatum]|nr:hypothetical protein LB504_001868 [Fusarium proliferatum]
MGRSVLLVTTSCNRLGLWGLSSSSRRLSSLDAVLGWSGDIGSVFIALGVLLVAFSFSVIVTLFLLFFLLLGIAIGFFGVCLGRLALLHRRLG